MRLVEELGAIRLRSDIERKRLFGEQVAPLHGQLDSGIYSAQSGAATYQHLHQLAAAVLHSGQPVVIDATYLRQAQRESARQVAETAGVPFLILDCHAPQAVLARWLEQRRREGSDPSDATLAVVEAQQASREELTAEERRYSTYVDTPEQSSIDSLARRIRQQLLGS
jgi:hypothetical protein